MNITADFEVEKDILKARPTLKESTVKQYGVQLRRLQVKFQGHNDTNYNFLGDTDKFMEKIADLNYLTQRNLVNSVIVLLMALNKDKQYDSLIDTYGFIRDKFNDKYTEENGDIISQKQAANFTTSEEIYRMLKNMKEDVGEFDDTNLSKKDKQLYQAYVLFSIYVRMPMRNDVAGMKSITGANFNKLSEAEKSENNYLILGRSNMSFLLNDYKTNKRYGSLSLDIDDKELKSILRNWIKLNGHGVLFKTSTGKPITRIELSKILAKYSDLYLDKSISTTLLRKIFLSSKYGQDGGLKDQLKELEKDNKVMAHSKEVALNTYVKKAR
jgi:hypothetical protein